MFNTPTAAPFAAAPSLMRAEDRIAEIGRILAAGLRRMRQKSAPNTFAIEMSPGVQPSARGRQTRRLLHGETDRSRQHRASVVIP